VIENENPVIIDFEYFLCKHDVPFESIYQDKDHSMRWKKILLIITLVVAVLIIGVNIFFSFYDFKKFKPLISRAVSDTTGREFTIGGDIDFKPGFIPALVVEDVSFQNAPWGSRPLLASAKKLEVKISLLSLLRGNYKFIELVLREPDVIFEINRDGTSNFVFETPDDDGQMTDDNGKQSLPVLVFNDIRIEKGLFTYKDKRSDKTYRAELDHLSASIPGLKKSLLLDFKGTIDQIPLALKGTIGPIMAWIEPGLSFPVDATARAYGASFSVQGELSDPIDFKGMDFTISAEGPSTLEILRLAGITEIPDLGAFKVSGKVSEPEGNLALEGLKLHAGSEKLVKLSLAGAVNDLLAPKGINLAFSITGTDISNLEKMGVPDLPFGGPFSVSGQFSEPKPDLYRVESLKFGLGDNEGTGNFELNVSKKRPAIVAQLSSERLDLRPLWEKIDKDDPAKDQPEKSPMQREKVFSPDPWPLDTLKMVDAEVKVWHKEVLLPKLTVHDVQIDMVLKEGNLNVKPVNLNIDRGSAEGNLDLASQKIASAVSTGLRINNLDLGSFLEQLGQPGLLEGTLDSDVSLSGKGNSTSDLMAGLNGRIFISVIDGQMYNKRLGQLEEIFGSGILRLLNPFRDKSASRKVNCFVKETIIKDGLAEIKILLDTDQTSIVIAGDVNLKTEALNLGIKPTPKKRNGDRGSIGLSLKELSEPFRLGGTLAKPSLQLDPGRTTVTLAKFAGALAIGPAGLAIYLSDVSDGKKDLCAEAFKATGDTEEKTGQEGDDGEKQTEEKKSGGLFKNIFRRQ
jgi:uncharacterized protein involved in outer membrane biogenesis